MDIIDKTLRCVTEKWDRRDGVQSIRAASRLFEQDTVDSIRGTVHIIPTNVGINLLHNDAWRKNEVDGFNDECSDRTKNNACIYFLRRKPRLVILSVITKVNI